MLVMDSIQEILNKKLIQEPEEFKIIREFVASKIGIKPRLESNKKQITIYIPNAADAGELRQYVHLLQKKINLRLVIRIG